MNVNHSHFMLPIHVMRVGTIAGARKATASLPSFHELFTAIPKAERTEKTAITIALWTLGAIAPGEGVAVAPVREILRVQLKGKAPKNPSTVLTRAVPYVESTRLGSSLTWRLTQSGLDWLSGLTGKSLQHPTTASPSAGYIGEADVAILCALNQPELAALKRSFGGDAQWKMIDRKDLTHLFSETRIRTKAGTPLRVVASTSTSMGLTGAAIAATHLILGFRPQLLVMTGIAAGTKDGALGDILVADPSVDYASGKVELRNGVREFLPDPYPIPIDARLRNVLRDATRMDPLLETVRAKWTSKHPSRMLKLHVGPLGAADQVINDHTKVLEIRKNWRKLVGIEMETYAVYRAAHEAPAPKPMFLALKSVCDFADKKSDNWQDYAAFTSSEFLFNLLILEWEEILRQEQ
jgi:nucleoside phosphorylase